MTVYVQDPDLTIHLGDVRDVLAELPDGSVDCVITSPPYWGLRDYQVDGQLGLEATPDEYVASMVEVFREVRRVLTDTGTVWCNLGDSYASSPPGNVAGVGATSGLHGANDANGVYRETLKAGHATKRNTVVAGLKPKDLVGIPWRVAFALQADGWYLRSDIVWAKPNPMPESVTDRPTKSHEYVFLLAKQPRYFFDQEAVREPYRPTSLERDAYGYNHAFANQFKGSPTDDRHPDGKQLPPGSFAKGPDGRSVTRVVGKDGSEQRRNGERWPNPSGRNIRSVWEIATQPYPEAHFATYPEELVRRCLLAGCPEWVCGTCGKPRERIAETRIDETRPPARRNIIPPEVTKAGQGTNAIGSSTWGQWTTRETLGWSDCGHGNYRPGVVLDPFGGSGTTALVARRHNRRSILVELNEQYAALAAARLGQQSLFATVP